MLGVQIVFEGMSKGQWVLLFDSEISLVGGVG